jgi:mannose-6-phosphate isomerase-like protein (cupin superfamily)
MKIVRLPTHPGLATPDSPEARRFGAVWEVELDSGEATQPHRHDDLEEIYCFVEGEGEIVVAHKKKPVARGEVIHIPRLTSHWVENNSRGLLRCLAIESPADPAAVEAGAEGEGAKPETVGALEKAISDLPRDAEMDQVAAIKNIVALFDIAGRLSEQIERAFGLDNEEGTEALGRIEKRIMDAVVEITKRYQKHTGRDLGGFGGRLSLS